MKRKTRDRIEIYGVEAIIFDLDAVMKNIAEIHKQAWEYTLNPLLLKRNAHSFQPEYEYDVFLAGKTRFQGLSDFLQYRKIDIPTGKPGDEVNEETRYGLSKQKNKYFLELIKQEEESIYPDIERQIKKWKKAGMKIVITSSSKNTRDMLRASGLYRYFDMVVDGIIASTLGLRSKPHPDILMEAGRQSSINPENTAVIDVTLSGVRAANDGDFGIVIGINRRGKRKLLLDNGADLVVSSLDDVHIYRSQAEEPQVYQSLPSALKEGEDLFDSIKNHQPAIFFDYDGTLSPIVDHPEDAIISDEMRQKLEELSRHTKVAIVSGRDMEDVKKLVNLEGIIYAGSHGFRIQGPGNLEMEHDESQAIISLLDGAENEINEQIRGMKGVMIERKTYAIAVHYRNIEDESKVDQLKENLEQYVNKNNNLKLGYGKKILELKPNIDWHKGKAVFWLLEALDLNQKEVLPLYLGDDITDEDAFKALADKGIGVLVGRHDEPTAAKYYLRNVYQVRQFIEKLIEVLG